MTAAHLSRWYGLGYDLLSRATFAPLGGLDRLRDEAMELVSVGAHTRVLELGCGTGGFTRRLVARGAEVTAVDRSPSALRRALRRAPDAAFVEAELTSFRTNPALRYDLALCAFVLHELDERGRHHVLTAARSALAPTGRLLVVEHALPDRRAGLLARLLSRFVHAFEPPTVVGWLRGGFTSELAAANFHITSRLSLARGTAVALVCAAT
jgi:ubiquinone/menaquinone biosynthesis C-methylase UbiE